MRKLTAAPYIIGIAFVRHEAAVAGMRGKSSDALDSNKLLVHPVCGNGVAANFTHASSLSDGFKRCSEFSGTDSLRYIPTEGRAGERDWLIPKKWCETRPA